MTPIYLITLSGISTKSIRTLITEQIIKRTMSDLKMPLKMADVNSDMKNPLRIPFVYDIQRG